jgi:hypothetical protein
MPDTSSEALLQFAQELLLPEGRPAFEAGWEWLEPQMRTEEERLLGAATLLLLRAFQALVVPRRLAPGVLASLHVTATRRAPEGPVRCHLFVVVTPDGALPAGSEPDTLCLSGAQVCAAPFRAAAAVLAEVLTRLSET